MNGIIKLEQVEDFEIYNTLLTLNEDLDFDNQFCVLNTNIGNIAFSYYDLGIAPSFILQNEILFLSFGKSYYIINLKEKKILCQSNESLSAIFEIVRSDLHSCIVFIGEMSLFCFSLEGEAMWKNDYRTIIFNWAVKEEGIFVEFEDGKKVLVSFKNGNGVTIV